MHPNHKKAYVLPKTTSISHTTNEPLDWVTL